MLFTGFTSIFHLYFLYIYIFWIINNWVCLKRNVSRLYKNNKKRRKKRRKKEKQVNESIHFVLNSNIIDCVCVSMFLDAARHKSIQYSLCRFEITYFASRTVYPKHVVFTCISRCTKQTKQKFVKVSLNFRVAQKKQTSK